MPTIHATVTFFVGIWWLMLRLGRSFAGLFTRTNPPTDSCTLPVVRERNATPVHSQRSISFRPTALSEGKLLYTAFRVHHYSRRKFGTNPSSPPRCNNDVVGAEPPTLHDVVVPQISDVGSTSVAELGCSSTIMPLTTTFELFSPSRGSLPITTQTCVSWTSASSSPVRHAPMSPSLVGIPLTPPNRCYLAPVPPIHELYYESWPTPADRYVPRKPVSSPLKTCFRSETLFPEPAVCSWDPSYRTSPVKIWTSTPSKETGGSASCGDGGLLPATACPPTDAVLGVTHSSCVTSFFDHASSASSESDLFHFSVCARIPDPQDVKNESSSHEPDRALSSAHTLQHKSTPSVHELLIWRRYGSRVPGKNRLASSEWYGASAYVASPVGLLSPPDSPMSSDTDSTTVSPCYRKNWLFGDPGLQNGDGRMLSEIDNRTRDGSSWKRDVILDDNKKMQETVCPV